MLPECVMYFALLFSMVECAVGVDWRDVCSDCMMLGFSVCGVWKTLPNVGGLLLWASESSAWSFGGGGCETGRMWQRFLLYVFPLDWMIEERGSLQFSFTVPSWSHPSGVCMPTT